MALSVLFEPVPATTGTRPLTTRTAVSMTSRSSDSLRVGDSPVVPQGTRPWMPCCIWNSTRFSRASTSTSPFLNGVMRAVNAPLNISLLQFEVLVEAPDRLFYSLRRHHARYLYLRGRDHPDRDAGFSQGSEHLCRVTGTVQHPGPDDRNLAQVFLSLDFAAQGCRYFRCQSLRFGEVATGYGEGNIRGPFLQAALNDDVHGYATFCQRCEDAAHGAGAGLYAVQGDARDIHVMDDTGDGLAGLQMFQ